MGLVIRGTNGDELLQGTTADDELYGYAGNDTLYGFDGKDILHGGDGNDILGGHEGDDVLIGGRGTDQLCGGFGNDTYKFARGDGKDIIYEKGGVDSIKFSPGILPEELIVRRGGNSDTNSLEFNIAGTTDLIIVKDYFSGDQYKIEAVEFANGTVWDRYYIESLLKNKVVGTDNAETLSGTSGNDVFYGLGGNDTIYAYAGDDILYGGDGKDILGGHDGNDILDGGTGNDQLCGGIGNDTYIFARGYGMDVIYEKDGEDRIKFAEGINPEDLIFKRCGYKDENSLQIIIKGTDDVIIIKDYYLNGANTIEKLEFSNGLVIDLNIPAEPTKIMGTEAGEELWGTMESDHIYGLGGNDIIYGGGGNDLIDGGTGDDMLLSGEGNDTLIGGAGNDYLSGDGGSDNYLFSGAFGRDRICELDLTSSDSDSVTIDMNPINLIFSKDGYDLRVDVFGTNNSIAVDSWYFGSEYHVENFKAANGKVLTNTKVEQLVQAMAAFSNNTGMSWSQAIQDRPEDVQNILNQYWVTQP